jgi:hypothetical protein
MRRVNLACVTCRFWQEKIDEQRERALKGAEHSFRRETKARRELNQHLSHGDHVYGEEPQHDFTATCSPWPLKQERERWGGV